MALAGTAGRIARHGLLACAVMAAGACATAPAQPTAVSADATRPPSDEEVAIEQGRMIALTQCAACHAIGETGDSPRADAPPLRRVLARYDRDALEIDLMEGMRVGHSEMPRFTFDPRTVGPLLIYLESIQDWGLAARGAADGAAQAR